MERKTAEALIRQYFKSWLNQDIELCLQTLTPEVKIVECYGPVYCGKEEVRQWFSNWHVGSGKGKVTRWEIINVLYDHEQQLAAIEWDVECI
jgi:ketosteroid isomerase-like protein